MSLPANRCGYILLLALVFAGLMAAALSSAVDYATLGARSERISVASAQALALADAGIDKAIYELNQNSSFSGETYSSVPGGVFVTSITTSGSSKRITSTGYVPSQTNPTAVRTVMATADTGGTWAAFHYGVQVGNGGFIMNGGSVVNGSIYSNGDIAATNGVTITGSAIAANPIATTTDQSNDAPTPISSCTGSTCITFADAVGTQDVAQSFQISSAVGLNNIQFYIKKVGSPANATVRIVNDATGVPSTDTLMTGTLTASTVTTNFGWVTVTLPDTPVLDPGLAYWVVIDAASNASNYYIIGANSSYGSGAAKIGRYSSSWSDTSPSGLDSYFKLAIGGGTSLIGGSSYSTGVMIGTSGTDEAWAHTMKGVTVSGPLYCQASTYTNKSCNTSRADPTPEPMPFSDNNLQDLKDDAATGGTYSGNYTVGWAGATLGPKKIDGNLTVGGGGTLTLTGTLWVTGSVTVSGGGQVRLHSSYGTDDGAIISDGPIEISGGASFSGSGTAGSYPFLITTSACPAVPGCSGENAIELTGGAGAVALVAQDGTVELSGGSGLKAVTGKQITMTGGASLTYDSGLVNSNFYSGPGGSWEFVPGSYVIVQ
ncbi:hypothetical protein FJY94_01440 [Candidatus Kaiserbacteria bacterium]|nr:hypothetical protein [Candidatus Kaiserbacteria bacterium]